MGPAPTSNLPSRPRFTWDAKSPPWTDGKGDQEEYRDAVHLWQMFNNALPASNNNKIPAALQAICLKSQLYGRAKDLCSGITDQQLTSDGAVELLVGRVYQRDALTVVSEAYRAFNALWSTRRNANENMKNFESRFSAQVAKFNSISTTTKLPECITALMLLSNSAIDDTQRVSVLAAAAPSDDNLNAQSTNDQFLSAITYQSVSSVIRQCDQSSAASENLNALNASSAGTTYRGKGNRSRGNITMKFPCDKCGKYGHWKRNHNPDGSLPPHVKSFDSPQISQSRNDRNQSSPSLDQGEKSKKKTLSFSMAKLSGSSASLPITGLLGPLVDDGAPYSAIGQVELNLLTEHAGLQTDHKLDKIPKALKGHTHWQYGTGKHASPARRILGSTVLTAISDSSNSINITHLVLEGSSQWVIGRNVTRKANIEHLERNALAVVADGITDYVSMIDHEFLSYIPLDCFTANRKSASTMSCLSAVTTCDKPWSEVKKVIDKVHKHVCGHATLTDYKLLLERNHLWNDSVASYIARTMEECTGCRCTAPALPSRKVSISSLSKNFNEIVCVDHLYLEEVLMAHYMDLVSRYSAAYIVSSTQLNEAVLGFEAAWVGQFWYPDSIQVDKAFQVGEFKSYADKLGIQIRPVPPGRHSRNPIESKHNIIRSVYLRLKEAAGTDFAPKLAAQKAVSISNDLYGNDIMSAFELAKGFTNPVASKPQECIVPDDVRDARDKMQARRKLALILRSKAVQELPISVGDMVEIFQKREHEKRGKWAAAKPILSVNHDARSITVPGKSGHCITVAVEDVRPAIPQNSFAQHVQDGIDTLDELLHEKTSEITEIDATGNGESNDETQEPVDDDFSTENAKSEPVIGDRISVFWPLDDQFYDGTVQSADDNGRFEIHYDDGDTENLELTNEHWKFASVLPASTGRVADKLEVTSTESSVLSSMLENFGNKAFLIHQAQGFDQFPLVNAYKAEEETFLKTVRPVSKCKIPPASNIINSHVLYKVKQNDDGTLKLKARIAPHGNEDDLKELLSKDCTTCPPTGLRILESIASLFAWTLYKADVKAAFLQTGTAQRDVYVRPPRESKMKGSHLWALLTAAYGLVNANAKWQNQSDQLMFDIGLVQSTHVPQLFFQNENGRLVLIVAKIVDDLKVAGEGDRAKLFLDKFDKKFKFGNVNHGPGKLRYFGINTIQNVDFTVETNADDKLDGVQEYPLSRQRRKEYNEALTKLEKSTFASINSSLGWIGTAASPLCSFYSSYLQQKAPNTKVSHMVEQTNILRKMKKLGTVISYPRPTDKREHELSVLVFADASRVDEAGQLGVLTGLLVGEMKSNSIYHPISWISHKAKRPVKSVPAAEILAAGEGIDEGKVIAAAYSELLDMDIRVRLCVDSKDLFTSLSTQRNSIDRAIRADVGCIRYEFQTGAVEKISWIPGNTNLADPLTKKDSSLTDTLRLTLFSGRLCMDFDAVSETKSSEKNFG